MDLWRHGRYLDFWSLVHLLSGGLLALSCYGLGYGFWAASLISLILLVAWELFEWAVRIIEPTTNAGFDIVIGVLGFLLGAYWNYFLENAFDVTVFGLCFLAVIGLSAWGFLDFYFRGYR